MTSRKLAFALAATIVSFAITGNAQTFSPAIKTSKPQVHDAAWDANVKAFEAKVTENRLIYKRIFTVDSTRLANRRFFVLDSLQRAGVKITDQLRNSIFQEAGSGGNSRTISRGVTTYALDASNLGFENGLTDWTGIIGFNLKNLVPADEVTWMPNILDKDGPISQGATPLDLKKGGTTVRSYMDVQPWKLFQAGDPVQLVNQPPRHYIISDITDPDYVDPYGGFKIIQPFTGSKVARIGNETVGYSEDNPRADGASRALYEQEKLVYSFPVDLTTPFIVINYAVVLADPSAYGSSNNDHQGENKTYFKITLTRANGTEVKCATYDVYANAGTSHIPGFVVSNKNWKYQNNNIKQVLYKPWSQSLIDLSQLPSGEMVTLTFATGDCLSGGHFAYAYVDALTTNLGINAKSNGVEKTSFCSGEVINFSSPIQGRYTGEGYNWTFGDGSNSALKSPSKAYTVSTSTYYDVLLNITDPAHSPGDNCSLNAVKKRIQIFPLVSAAFTLSAPSPTPGQSVTLTLSNYVTGNINTINWGDGSTTSNVSATATHTWTKAGQFNIKVTSSNSSVCSDTQTKQIEVSLLCATDLPNSTAGSFLMDKVTGNYVYQKSACPVIGLMPCMSGQPTALSKVVRADATLFSDNWPYTTWFADNSTTQFATAADAFETGERGKWRVKANYTYNTSLAAEPKNFKAGTFTPVGFNWKTPANNNPSKWLLGSQVTAYSPHGDAVSEMNVLGIESAAKFGYNNAVPYLTAKNAGYSSVFFESFENVYVNKLEDKMLVPSNGSLDDIRKNSQNASHSGYYSWRLANGGSIDLSQFSLTSAQMAKGLSIKVWIKQNVSDVQRTYESSGLNSYDLLNRKGVDPIFFVGIRNQTISLVPFSVIARTGEWVLCEAKITSFGTVAAGAPFYLKLQYDLPQTVWIDDIRVQPLDAEMNCYVYDNKTLKLLATFDDQHFGLYYQYNSEGKLVRKMRETERGLRTVQETQYNTKLQ